VVAASSLLRSGAGCRSSLGRRRRAYDAGDYARAAQELAKADGLAHSPVTLELALKAALRADDPVLTMTLAARATQRHSATLAAAADAARAKMEKRTGRVTLACAPATTCTATLDGIATEIGEPQYVLPGAHRIAFDTRGTHEEVAARVEPDARLRATRTAPRWSGSRSP
jgi:hypothetical protein